MKVNISVDPGVVGTGYAVWQSPEENNWGKSCKPISTGCIKPSIKNKESFLNRSTFTTEQFQHLFLLYEVNQVAVEYGKFFESSLGFAAASGGDLAKLLFVTGRIVECCYRNDSFAFSVLVNDWKGTMTKKIVDHRIKREIGCEYDNHESDAVGIGLWVKKQPESFFQKIAAQEEELWKMLN